MSLAAPTEAVRNCGCSGRALWRCDLCSDTGREYLACSRPCLRRHQRHHAGAGDALGARLVRQQRENNGANAANWASFADHRARLTRLLSAVQRGEGLCVLGAGNGDDLDLPALVREFGEVHLVDLDEAALTRARARLPEPIARRVVSHGGVELTGILEHLDDGEASEEACDRWLATASEALATRLGRAFDVVLSSCVVSQLCVPLYRALARRPDEWTRLMRAVGRAHVRALTALARPGGTAVLLGDAFYARGATPPEAPQWETLDPRVRRALHEGFMRLRDPRLLMELVDAAARAGEVEPPRLTEPWLWTVEESVMLVYAILFRRA